MTGGDVGDYHQRYSDDMIGMRSYERALENTFAEIIHCPKPVIHRINGDVRRRRERLPSRRRLSR